MKTITSYSECKFCGSEDLTYDSSEVPENEKHPEFDTTVASCVECGIEEVVRITEEVHPHLQVLIYRLHPALMDEYLNRIYNTFINKKFRHKESGATYIVKGVTLLSHDGQSLPALSYIDVKYEDVAKHIPHTRTLSEFLDGRYTSLDHVNLKRLVEQIYDLLEAEISLSK